MSTATCYCCGGPNAEGTWTKGRAGVPSRFVFWCERCKKKVRAEDRARIDAARVRIHEEQAELF